MLNIIEKMEIKFQNIEQVLIKLIEKALLNKILLTEFDIMEALKLTQPEFEFLSEFAKYNLNEQEMEVMKKLSDLFNKKKKLIDIVNEKTILTNPRVANKNTISFLLSKDKGESETHNVIINVAVDNEFDKVDFEKLGIKVENDK